MSLSLLSRYAFFAVCVIFTLASLPFIQHEWLWPITVVTGILSLIGIFDLLQSPHAVRRNYPILGNIRYLVEAIRPEIRQYLLESDSDALPFSRAQASSSPSAKSNAYTAGLSSSSTLNHCNSPLTIPMLTKT